MKVRYLSGANIYLRPLERADAPLFVEWLNDPEVTRRLDRTEPVTLETEEAYIAKLYDGEHDLGLGIALHATDQLIGATGLHQIDFRNRSAMFGIFIGRQELWGHGYGREATELMVTHAFETLNLQRVWLQVFADHRRAIGAYERVGFRVEGTLRAARFRDGRYWDVLVMGILADERH